MCEQRSSRKAHSILISCSPFHAEKIPPKRTILAIAIALEVFGPQGVIVYLSEWLDQVVRFGIDKPTPLMHYVESFGPQPAGVMFWEGYGLISGGRSGYRLGHLTTKKKTPRFIDENCRTEILYAQHSHFDVYGNYIAGFCGGLTVGDWHELPELLGKYRREDYPPLIEILINKGPHGLYKLAQRDYGYKPLRCGYAGKCHLCVDVRKHLSAFDRFVELKPSGFYQDKFAEVGVVRSDILN